MQSPVIRATTLTLLRASLKRHINTHATARVARRACSIGSNCQLLCKRGAAWATISEAGTRISIKWMRRWELYLPAAKRIVWIKARSQGFPKNSKRSSKTNGSTSSFWSWISLWSLTRIRCRWTWETSFLMSSTIWWSSMTCWEMKTF